MDLGSEGCSLRPSSVPKRTERGGLASSVVVGRSRWKRNLSVATFLGATMAGSAGAAPPTASPAGKAASARAAGPSTTQQSAASGEQVAAAAKSREKSATIQGEPRSAPKLLAGRRRAGSFPQAASSPKQSKPRVAGEVEGGTKARPGSARAENRDPSRAEKGVSAPCLRPAVHFERGFGGDAQPIALTRCDGRPAPAAIEQLSILVRPMNAARPSPLASRIRRAAHREWLPGVKRIHEGLVTRLQRVVDRFRAQKITLVSGYRPTSLGSFHQSARALDLHVDGVRNEALVAFCRTLTDTGCGYYPNSSFVHIDVRPPGTGHVYWIDASGPGEPARYVSSWPPKDSMAKGAAVAADPAAPLDEQTHAGSALRPPLGGTDSKIDARTTAPWWGGDRDPAFSP